MSYKKKLKTQIRCNDCNANLRYNPSYQTLICYVCNTIKKGDKYATQLKKENIQMVG